MPSREAEDATPGPDVITVAAGVRVEPDREQVLACRHPRRSRVRSCGGCLPARVMPVTVFVFRVHVSYYEMPESKETTCQRRRNPLPGPRSAAEAAPPGRLPGSPTGPGPERRPARSPARGPARGRANNAHVRRTAATSRDDTDPSGSCGEPKPRTTHHADRHRGSPRTSRRLVLATCGARALDRCRHPALRELDCLPPPRAGRHLRNCSLRGIPARRPGRTDVSGASGLHGDGRLRFRARHHRVASPRWWGWRWASAPR
jgi:hypothetical protein